MFWRGTIEKRFCEIYKIQNKISLGGIFSFVYSCRYRKLRYLELMIASKIQIQISAAAAADFEFWY